MAHDRHPHQGNLIQVVWKMFILCAFSTPLYYHVMFHVMSSCTLFLSLTPFVSLGVVEGQQQSQNQASRPASSGMDAFFDNILKAVISQKADLIDPFALESIDLEFSQRVTFVRVSGSAKLDDISLSGLKTLKRTGPVNQATDELTGDKRTTLQLAVGPLNFTSTGKIKFLGVTLNRKFLGKINFMEFETTLKALKNSQKIEVESYDIIQMKDLSLKASSIKSSALGLTDAVTNTVIRMAIRLFRKRITVSTERALTSIIAEKINDLPPNVKLIMGG